LTPFAYLKDVIDRLPFGKEPNRLHPVDWRVEQLEAISMQESWPPATTHGMGNSIAT